MQNFYMQIISKQNESAIGCLVKLTNSIDGLRKILGGPENSSKNCKRRQFLEDENCEMECSNKENLLKTISCQEKFLYKIVLKNPLVQPLVKERNFK